MTEVSMLGTPPRLIQILAEADAFANLGLTRREALWEAKAHLSHDPLPLFAGDLDGEGITEPKVDLPKMTEGEEVVEDYVSSHARRTAMLLISSLLCLLAGTVGVISVLKISLGA